MCRYCVLTTYSTLEGSLMPMSSHYPSTVTTLDLSHQTLALPGFALDLPSQKLQVSPPCKLLEGLISPFTFRCTVHLEIILTYGVGYGGGCQFPPEDIQLPYLIYCRVFPPLPCSVTFCLKSDDGTCGSLLMGSLWSVVPLLCLSSFTQNYTVIIITKSIFTVSFSFPPLCLCYASPLGFSHGFQNQLVNFDKMHPLGL